MKSLKPFLPWLALVALLTLAALPQLDISNFDGIHLSGSFGTATPQFLVQNLGSSNSIEVRSTAGANVFSVGSDGAINASGVLTNSTMPNLVVSAATAIGTATPAVFVNNAGVSNLVEVQDGGVARIQAFDGGGVVIAAPTAITTAVPAFYVDSAGASSIVEVRKNATPQVVVGSSGAVTLNQAVTENGGSTNNVWVKVAAPTAIATATPALVVDSAGVSELLSVRKNATPVLSVNGSGAVTGLVLQYGTSGQKLVCSSETITGSASVSHGLATPVAQWCAMGADIIGDAANCTAVNASGLVTISVFSGAATPAASTSAIAVNWCVIGTP